MEFIYIYITVSAIIFIKVHIHFTNVCTFSINNVSINNCWNEKHF